MKMIKTTPEGVTIVSGATPSKMNYRDTSAALKTWIHFKLFQLNCNKDHVKILYTDNTKNDAEELFKGSDFSSGHWNTFIGSEVPVVVCLYSAETDHPYILLNMTSRAQQQVLVTIWFYQNYLFWFILSFS